jgi:hypothetical protein
VAMENGMTNFSGQTDVVRDASVGLKAQPAILVAGQQDPLATCFF